MGLSGAPGGDIRSTSSKVKQAFEPERTNHAMKPSIDISFYLKYLIRYNTRLIITLISIDVVMGKYKLNPGLVILMSPGSLPIQEKPPPILKIIPSRIRIMPAKMSVVPNCLTV